MLLALGDTHIASCSSVMDTECQSILKPISHVTKRECALVPPPTLCLQCGPEMILRPEMPVLAAAAPGLA